MQCVDAVDTVIAVKEIFDWVDLIWVSPAGMKVCWKRIRASSPRAAARPVAGSPRFRRDPFARDVLFDPGGTTVSRIATLHMLRSAISNSLRSRDFIIPWLNRTSHSTAVYASCSALPPPHATLASRRLARPYLGRTCIG